MAEAKKEREQSKGKRCPTPQTPPANDPWTADLPPYDPSQDPAVNGNGDESGDGKWGTLWKWPANARSLGRFG